MPDHGHMFSLERPGGPESVRVLQPSDWSTISGQTPFELEVEGYGDLDIHFIEIGDFLEAGGSNSRVTSVACIGARDHVSVRPPAELPVGPIIIQIVRRYDGVVMATAAAVIALNAQETQHALRRISATRAPISAPPLTRHEGKTLFGITTTVWNTPPNLLLELADCILNQSWADFEWLLLDNGSSEQVVIDALTGIARRDTRVRYFRVEQNIHIIPGNRYLLERAAGDYIVPVDSDDMVALDALERLAAYIEEQGRPTLLYSDEIKIVESGEPLELLWRSAVDPLGALSTCPASHLMAFSRDAALRADVYGDTYAKGSHDWDTYLRLTDRGERVVHVPEVLYGWRVHATSAAGDETVKDYLVQSQLAVVEHSLLRRGLDAQFDVRLASSETRIGYFHAVRRSSNLPTLDLDIIVRDPELTADIDNARKILESCDVAAVKGRVVFVVGKGVDAAVRELGQEGETLVVADLDQLNMAVWRSDRQAEFKAVVDARLRPMHEDWIRDALGTMELDDAVGIVGGCIIDATGGIVHAGFVAGLDGLMATPNHGMQRSSVVKNAALCRRRVSAVYGGLMLLRTRLFDEIGTPLGVDGPDVLNGIEYSLRARRAGWAVAYCPTFLAERQETLIPPALMSIAQRKSLLEQYGDDFNRDPYYNPFLSDRSNSYGTLRKW